MTVPLLRPSFNEFIRTASPDNGLTLPPDALTACRAFIETERRLGRSAHSAFVIGGVFTSVMRGERPKDIDLVVCTPELLHNLELAAHYMRAPARSYAEMKERHDLRAAVERALFPPGYGYSITVAECEAVKTTPVMGKVSGFSVLDHKTGLVVDVMCCAVPVTPEQFFVHYSDAPVRSAAYDMESGEFCYHRDFEDDVKAWRYRPFCRPNEKAFAKAREKGMTIVMPS